jgi:hypothetical protein
MNIIYLILFFSLIPLTDFLLKNIQLSNLCDNDNDNNKNKNKNKKQSISSYLKEVLMNREDIYFMLIFLIWLIIFIIILCSKY